MCTSWLVLLFYWRSCFCAESFLVDVPKHYVLVKGIDFLNWRLWIGFILFLDCTLVLIDSMSLNFSGYNSTLRNNVRSRAWGAAIVCSYRVERCCIVKVVAMFTCFPYALSATFNQLNHMFILHAHRKEVELLILNLALHIHQLWSLL